MKLIQMQYFRAVCKYNNITKAAAELHITQPSISNAIKDLEEEFGVNLFYRLSKGISLTDEGHIFLERASKILDSVDELSALMSSLSNRAQGVKIGVPPMISTILFPQMFQQFRKLYPDVTLTINDQGSSHLRELVADGSLDVAIISTSAQDSMNFERVNIQDTEILFCVSKGHPLAQASSVTVNLIQQEPLVLLREDSYQTIAIKKLYKKYGVTPNVILYSNQIHAIKELVANGSASTVFFRGVVAPVDGIVEIPFEEPIIVKLDLIWNKNHHLHSDVAKFIDFTRGYQPE